MNIAAIELHNAFRILDSSKPVDFLGIMTLILPCRVALKYEGVGIRSIVWYL